MGLWCLLRALLDTMLRLVLIATALAHAHQNPKSAAATSLVGEKNVKTQAKKAPEAFVGRVIYLGWIWGFISIIMHNDMMTVHSMFHYRNIICMISVYLLIFKIIREPASIWLRTEPIKLKL